MLVVIAYVGYKFYNLINKSDPELSRKEFVIDLAKENDVDYKVGEGGFDIAFEIRSQGKLLPSYGSISLT